MGGPDACWFAGGLLDDVGQLVRDQHVARRIVVPENSCDPGPQAAPGLALEQDHFPILGIVKGHDLAAQHAHRLALEVGSRGVKSRQLADLSRAL